MASVVRVAYRKREPVFRLQTPPHTALRKGGKTGDPTRIRMLHVAHFSEGWTCDSLQDLDTLKHPVHGLPGVFNAAESCDHIPPPKRSSLM